ncbi:hypothetical protein ACYCSU_17050 [Paenibacillus sp. ALE1]
MKIERYVIELTNDKFARLEWESDRDIFVESTSNFFEAELMRKNDAESIFNDLMNDSDEWYFYGACITPKAIRKVEIELFMIT